MKKENMMVIIDGLIVISCLYLALILRFDFNVSVYYLEFYYLSIIPVAIITIIFNKIFKLYANLWKYASVQELFSIICSVTVSNLVFLAYGYIFNYLIFKSVYFRFPLTVHIIFWLLSVVFLGGIRFIFRMVESREMEKGQINKRVNTIVIGAGDAGALLIKELQNNTTLDYKVIGVIDDDITKKGKRIHGVKVLGTRKDIKRICNDYKIEDIIVAMPSVEVEDRKQILNICKETKCKLKTMPGIYEMIDDNVSVNKIRDINIEDLLGREQVKLKTEHIEEYIKEKVILVTGGGGSIGSELCRQIAKFNPKLLIILDIYENNAYDLEMELNRNIPELNKKVIIASIRDENRLDEIFNEYRPDVVFHAAAHKHVPLMENNPLEAIKNNIIGTYNVVKCSDKYKVKRFVQISTDKAVNPTNVMGATKRFCELIIQGFNESSSTEFVAVRFGNVLGSNGSVIPLFKAQIAKGGPVTVTHPDINRFFMTIPEAAQLVIQAGAMADGGEIFVLDMGKPVKIVDLARDMISLSGYRPDEDIKIEYVGLRPGEKLYEELLMDERALTSTEHEKIFVEKPKDASREFIESSIEEFKQINDGEYDKVISLLQKKVPTYKRKNNEESKA